MTDVSRLLSSAATGVRVRGVIGRAQRPGGSWKQSKFWITNDHAFVYAEEGGRPVLVAQAEIVGFEKLGKSYEVETTEGETWTLTPTGHCACGSSLKHFDPFPPPRREGT